MIRLILNMLSVLLNRLSLKWIHCIGSYLGCLFYLIATKQNKLLVENLKQSGLFPSEHALQQAVRNNQQEMGKFILESLAIWSRSQAQVLQWVRHVYGKACLDEAIAQTQGILFLTPHIGCFEITSIYYASMQPITILHRDSRKSWMHALMQEGRKKGAVTLAPANLKGVRLMLRNLHAHQAVGILPDQIASKGRGEWVDFFGRPMYTMTLVSQLLSRVDVRVIVVVAERLADGQGYDLHLQALNAEAVSSPAKLNQMLEALVKKFPLQYMWSYDRYKKP
ncbi:lysophospholipid acyltransferase family protein [Methylophilus aquaticus]|uniref:Lysophospholipid acyltransferase family protein n=1 Tax=Methylophilus aquaticus TaxID=1971610 RepID=A0ABT9JV15_9PROT|nr:lysophospholipid acyltransferase family protein [Methylophilus aquaticus]MDP8567971.1 lysophospholipid acyltransferase family protein [Methylophilus aquaticus]